MTSDNFVIEAFIWYFCFDEFETNKKSVKKHKNSTKDFVSYGTGIVYQITVFDCSDSQF